MQEIENLKNNLEKIKLFIDSHRKLCEKLNKNFSNISIFKTEFDNLGEIIIILENSFNLIDEIATKLNNLYSSQELKNNKLKELSKILNNLAQSLDNLSNKEINMN